VTINAIWLSGSTNSAASCDRTLCTVWGEGGKDSGGDGGAGLGG
jgi:hypothetical protein